jgi:ribonuclease P/MRP protein subunit POP5
MRKAEEEAIRRARREIVRTRRADEMGLEEVVGASGGGRRTGDEEANLFAMDVDDAEDEDEQD